jgi:hypothetical protein
MTNFNTLSPAIALSAGISFSLSVITNRGRPFTMAAIGAIAVLTNNCVVGILKRFKWDADQFAEHNCISNAIKRSIQAVVSVVCTQNIMRLLGGPIFDIRDTVITTLVINIFFQLSDQLKKNDLKFGKIFVILA